MKANMSDTEVLIEKWNYMNEHYSCQCGFHRVTPEKTNKYIFTNFEDDRR